MASYPRVSRQGRVRLVHSIEDAQGIYCITNETTGWRYIGQTAGTFRKRFAAHRRQAVTNGALTVDLARHAFRFDVLEVVTDMTALVDRERFWIRHFIDIQTPLYNRHKGRHLQTWEP